MVANLSASPLVDHLSLVFAVVDGWSWDAIDDFALKFDLLDAPAAFAADAIAYFNKPEDVFVAEVILQHC